MELIKRHMAGHDAMCDALAKHGHSEEDTPDQMAEAIEAVLLTLAYDPHALRGAAMALADRIEAESRLAGRLIADQSGK